MHQNQKEISDDSGESSHVEKTSGKQEISRTQKLNQNSEKRAFGGAAVDPLVVNFEEGMRLVN